MFRMFYHSALLAAICSLAVVGQACAVGETQADLLRQAALGLRMSPNSNGVFVDAVTAGLTGAQLGVREGDVLVALNGAAANTPGQVVALVAGMKADEPIELRLRRASQTMTLRGRAVGKPLEAYPGARTDYGAVPFRDGRLRDILVTPQGDGEAPVVFLLPGFSCASIEPMDSVHPYRRLAAELSEAGVGFYRVEKPGVGDSTGGPRCAEIDFATELDAFRTAYKHLTDVRGVDPGRIFLFGHSLGGMQAPLLAAERPPRGVAAYGTVLRNWGDYHYNVDVFQAFLLSGADPVDQKEEAEANRDLFHRFYLLRQAPGDIVRERPDLAQPLRQLGWDGGERMLGRQFRFLQDLAALPVLAGWRDTRSQVLSLYGESDVVALFDVDHRLIADIANHYRPGTGRFVQVPATDHAMGLVGDREELRRRTVLAGVAPSGPFNSEITGVLVGWIRESMATPAVASSQSEE